MLQPLFFCLRNISYLYDSYWDTLLSLTGKIPAIMGMDLGYNDYSGDFTEIAVDIEEHWNSGGLITLSMHIPNPKTLADVKDKDFTSSDYADILKQGNLIRQRWLGMISNIANLFQVLKEKNIIILWRPLHEMNGGWFWWGNDQYIPSQEQFVNLWRDLYDYLSNTRQLDNLLWVYSPNFKYNSQQPDTNSFYPGNSYVDVVGLDYYRDQMDEMNTFESYNQLLTLGKPMAVCEIGSDSLRNGTFDNLSYLELLDNYPELSYFLVWHSYTNNKIAIHDNANASDLMNATQVITLDEISY